MSTHDSDSPNDSARRGFLTQVGASTVALLAAPALLHADLAAAKLAVRRQVAGQSQREEPPVLRRDRREFGVGSRLCDELAGHDEVDVRRDRQGSERRDRLASLLDPHGV
jgi:hypothetical protein